MELKDVRTPCATFIPYDVCFLSANIFHFLANGVSFICLQVNLSIICTCMYSVEGRWSGLLVKLQSGTYLLYFVSLFLNLLVVTVVAKRERGMYNYLPLWWPRLRTHLCGFWTLAADSVRTLNSFRIIVAIPISCPYFYGCKHRTKLPQQLSVDRDCSFFCLVW